MTDRDPVAAEEAAKRRAAIVERRKQVQAAPRPQQLGRDSVEIAQEAKRVQDTEDLWRVYRQEWITQFVSTQVGSDGKSEAEAHFHERYEGRLFDEDWLIEQASADRPAYLKLHLWNMRGEFKHKPAAESWTEEQFSDATIVGRNSREDYQLREYGIKKIPEFMKRERSDSN